MANVCSFKESLVNEINSWNKNLEVVTDKNLGFKYVGTPFKMSIIIRNKDNNKYLAIKSETQKQSGTACEKLCNTLECCSRTPIPTIIVFSGEPIRIDLKSKLISSGIGIEVGFDDTNGKIIDSHNLFKQRVFIELGLDFFELY